MKKHLAIIILVLSLGFVSCSVQNVVISNPSGIEAEELSMKAVKLKIFIPIENPNNFSFKIKNANLDLLVNGRNVGKITKIDKLKIPANSKETYPVSFEISPKEALTNVLYLVGELNRRKPELEVNGTITVAKFGIPKRIKVNHKQNIDKF
ncbi:MAG: LEA type 2 family protein [Bacteroidales bacterium]|jgi:LEA14-like dessication related protein|nr:LEA type 2 family protein [Bacteroidales bacterium]MDD4215742.1 LEA type 2 family protein [Bacteroidales bacterium]MDY0140349.1 LEA type 2 family protein [Bacteroidales bacterium]